MRILVVAHGFPPDACAGAELHAATLARELVRAGHETFVFAARRDGRSEDRVWEGVRVRAVGVEIPEDFAMRLRDERVRAEFERYLDDVEPDIVHVQHLLYLSGDLIEAAKARGLPVVVTLHDFWFQCPRIHLSRERHPFLGRLWGLACLRHHELRPLRRAAWLLRIGTFRRTVSEHVRRAQFLRDQLRLADCVIAPSRFLAERFVRFGVDPFKLAVVPHAVDVEATEREPSAPVEFGFVGSLAPDKGVHVLLEAFVRLPPDSRLTLFGACEDPAYLRTLRPFFIDRIRNAGPFDHQRLGDVLSRFDVLVVPSLVHESFSLVALEALAAGLPVVASRIGALPELVEHGRNGLLVPPGDVDALAQALRQLRDPAKVRRLGAAAGAPAGPAEHALRIESLYVRAAGALPTTTGTRADSPPSLQATPESSPAR